MESELAKAYGWAPRDFDSVDALEVTKHWFCCRLAHIEERQWSLTASAYPDMDKRGRSAIASSLRVEMSRLLGSDGTSYKQYRREDRIRLIGGALRSGSRNEWIKRHASELEWLAAEGVTEQQAIDSSLKMHADSVADLILIAAGK